MRRLVTIAVIASALVAHTGADSGSDTLWGSTGDTSLTVTGTRTREEPHRDASPGSRGSGAPRKDGTPCDPKRVNILSCGITAVRITAPDGSPLTITDLAAFAPAPATTVGEPDNLGVAGLPANLVTAATTQTQAGAVLDLPVTVRFTPVAFDTDYGDGVTASTTTGGRTWAELRQPEFTPTPTSHTYRSRGAYTVTTAVRYTAEVDLGNGWFSVPGELTIPGTPQRITVYEAHTGLVAHTCVEQPTAPGC